MTNYEATRTNWWNQPVGRIGAATAAVASTQTAWIIAALPALAFLAFTFFMSHGVTDPLVHALLAACIYLASVALAAVDEYALRAAGQRRTASPYWALLSSIPYLSARAAADESPRSLAVLWTAIAVITGTGVALWLMLLAG